MKATVACLALMVVGPATAQNSDWSFALSPYIWVPSITTRVETDWGRLAVDKSHGDVLGKLDVAFMGMFEARKGPWGLIADLFYADLAQSQETPLGLLFARSRMEIQARALSGYAAYRVHENDRVALDLMAGLRVYAVDIDVSLSPGLLPGQRLGMSTSWVDPLLGARARLAITDQWFATALADLGGFGVGSDLTWQLFASLGYQINDRWSVQGGWRYVSIDKPIDGRDVDLDFNGPLLGFTARF